MHVVRPTCTMTILEVQRLQQHALNHLPSIRHLQSSIHRSEQLKNIADFGTGACKEAFVISRHHTIILLQRPIGSDHIDCPSLTIASDFTTPGVTDEIFDDKR